MDNSFLLYEVANLHQRDVLKEVAMRRLSNQVKSTKNSRPRWIESIVMVIEILLKKLAARRMHKTHSHEMA